MSLFQYATTLVLVLFSQISFAQDDCLTNSNSTLIAALAVEGNIVLDTTQPMSIERAQSKGFSNLDSADATVFVEYSSLSGFFHSAVYASTCTTAGGVADKNNDGKIDLDDFTEIASDL